MTNWFECLGKEIPKERRKRAKNEYWKMGGTGNCDWINKTANYIESDRPEKAIEEAHKNIDLTGTYRLLAVLCVPIEQ